VVHVLQAGQPDDYVIATGQSYKLEEFVETAFSEIGLNWHDHVIVDLELIQPSDLAISQANPGKAGRELVWRARNRMPEGLEMMV